LGAGRGRLVRQLLTESTLLACAGGAFGLIFAAWTVGLLKAFVERFTSRTGEIAIDARVLLFTAAVSIVTGLVFGTLPALAPLVERLEAQPGVVSAAVTNAVPLRASQPGAAAFQIEGRAVDDPNRRPTADARIVSPGFFKTLGVPLVAGRTFTESDTREAPRV